MPPYPINFIAPPSPAVLFSEVKELTYSHAPRQSGFDLSDMQMAAPEGNGVVPFRMPDPAFDQSDPLGGFLGQSDTRPDATEADRIGADRYGASWPMMRAQRLHSGDTHVINAAMRRTLAESRTGGPIFTPLEMPQDPAQLYRVAAEPDSGRHKGRHGIF